MKITTRSATEMAKDLSYGIFWCLAETRDEIDEKHLLTFFKSCTIDGIPIDTDDFNAKSGMTYNHKATWSQMPRSITKGHSFDYYPRGRVEISRGKATIWLNRNILDLADKIKRLYGLYQVKVQVREDGSEHYKCHFDREE